MSKFVFSLVLFLDSDVLLFSRLRSRGLIFFGITISEAQAEAGVVIRVVSPMQSKFKVCPVHR
jgi:hypothetical protein